MNSFLVFVGAGLGGVLRYGVGLLAARGTGFPFGNLPFGTFPFGTLSVNILGSFLMGLLMGWLLVKPNAPLRLLLTTGVMGGFTTFSAFSYETLKLFMEGEMGLAAGYILLSVVLSLGACAVGFYLGR
jgi:fluoride exporter